MKWTKWNKNTGKELLKNKIDSGTPIVVFDSSWRIRQAFLQMDGNALYCLDNDFHVIPNVLGYIILPELPDWEEK